MTRIGIRMRDEECSALTWHVLMCCMYNSTDVEWNEKYSLRYHHVPFSGVVGDEEAVS